MKTSRWNTRSRTILAGLLVAGHSLLFWVMSSSAAQEYYEAYYWGIGEYPAGGSNGWSDGANGLTHDDDNWFIAQTPTGSPLKSQGKPMLWKIPVTRNLNAAACTDPGVACQTFDDWPKLKGEGYNHLGDPDYFFFEGQGYVLVPLEGGSRPAIGFFRADNLHYVNHAYLTGKTDAPWCATDRQGSVIISEFGNISPLFKYTVTWKQVVGGIGPLELTDPARITLYNESGSEVGVHDIQGGVTSPSGQLLYVTAGWPPHAGDPSHGIHVFDLTSGRRVQCSANPNDSGGRRTQCSSVAAGLFTFEFDESFSVSEEPEGLTIWDLDDGRAGDKIRGQLHVLLLDKDLTNDDDVFLKHYAGTIHVDGTYTGEEVGTPQKPIKTLTRAHSVAWDGATIRVRSGSYPEKLTLTKKVKVVAAGGSAVVGK